MDPKCSANAKCYQVLCCFISICLVPFTVNASAFPDPFIRGEEALGGGGPTVSQSWGGPWRSTPPQSRAPQARLHEQFAARGQGPSPELRPELLCEQFSELL